MLAGSLGRDFAKRSRKARARAKRPKRQRREVQAKLAGIDEEVERIREEAKRDAEAEAVRLRNLARQEAEMIERAAQAEIARRRSAGPAGAEGVCGASWPWNAPRGCLPARSRPKRKHTCSTHFVAGTREERELNEAVARRYASALADVALEQIKADRVKADFTRVRGGVLFVGRSAEFSGNARRRSGTEAESDREDRREDGLGSGGPQFYLFDRRSPPHGIAARNRAGLWRKN